MDLGTRKRHNLLELHQAIGLGESYLTAKPPELQLELTAKCNLSCRSCGRTHWGERRKPSELDPLLLPFLPPFLRLARGLTLGGYGEPTLSPLLLEVLSLGHTYACTTTLITNGTGCPGTPLASCSASFRAAFARADLIISKGQGNFETLSEVEAPIYFLLTVKCATVAEHLKEKTGNKVPALGDLVVLRNR